MANPAEKKRPMPKWIKYPLIGGAVVLVPVLGLILGISIHALMRPGAPPPSKADLKAVTERVLRVARAEDHTTTDTIVVEEDTPSTPTQAYVAAPPTFKPLISDGAPLNPTLTKIRVFINGSHAKVLQDIADYEKKRSLVDWRSKQIALIGIQVTYSVCVSRAVRDFMRRNDPSADQTDSATEYLAAAQALGIDVGSLTDIESWIDQASGELIETDPRAKNGANCINGANLYHSMSKLRLGRDSWSPVDPWDREVYYCRKAAEVVDSPLSGDFDISVRAVGLQYNALLLWLKGSPTEKMLDRIGGNK